MSFMQAENNSEINHSWYFPITIASNNDDDARSIWFSTFDSSYIR